MGQPQLWRCKGGPAPQSSSACSIAAHPFGKLRAGSCKKRKDGAPSVGMAYTTIMKAGPPATQNLIICRCGPPASARNFPRYFLACVPPGLDLSALRLPQNITNTKRKMAIGAQRKLGVLCMPWFKARTNTVKQPPATTTDGGSSLLDAALKPTIRNSIPSPALPGSTSREKGTRNESTNKDTANARRSHLLRVHSTPFHFGRNFSPQLSGSLNLIASPCSGRLPF